MGRMKDQLLNEALDENDIDILGIAMVKAFNHGHEYDPVSGRAVEKTGYLYLKDGYVQGFLDGFAHKFGGE